MSEVTASASQSPSVPEVKKKGMERTELGLRQTQGKAPKAVDKKKDDGSALLGITVKKEENLAEWYQQTLTKGGMISYYDVSGCYILKPWSWSIWKKIEAFFTERIELMGVEDCNFPLFISQDNLQREKNHIEGFAAEVAWVTQGYYLYEVST